jgi:hypothetical protein
MHGYAGNPGNYPITVRLIDDSDAPNASNFDLAPEDLADRTAYLQAQTGAAMAENWMPVTSVAGVAWYAALWDPATFGWLIALQDTSTFVAGIAAGSGQDPVGTGTWAAIGTTSGVNTWSATKSPRSLAADVDGIHYYLSAIDTSGAGAFQLYVVQGGVNYASIQFGTGAYKDAQMIFFGGYLVVALGHTTGASVALAVAAGPVPPATPITGIPINTISGVPGSPVVTGWITRSNGSYVLCCPLGTQANPFMLKSAPASNLTLVASWVAATAIAGVVSNTDNITGLDWGADAAGPCWLAAVKRGTTTRIIRSADGTNWTLVATLTGALAGGNFGSICYAAGRWLALMFVGPGVTVVFSLDGGATWWLTQVFLPWSSPILPTIVGSPTQAAAVAIGLMRFSQCAALPPAPLT